MKRDMDLVRLILLAIEEEPRGWAPKLVIEGYSEQQIGFHVQLMGEAGFIKTADVTPRESSSPIGIPVYMRWAGYEFLEAARTPSIWEAAKSKLKTAGTGIAFELLKETLLALARHQLGLSGSK